MGKSEVKKKSPQLLMPNCVLLLHVFIFKQKNALIPQSNVYLSAIKMKLNYRILSVLFLEVVDDVDQFVDLGPGFFSKPFEFVVSGTNCRQQFTDLCSLTAELFFWLGFFLGKIPRVACLSEENKLFYK